MITCKTNGIISSIILSFLVVCPIGCNWLNVYSDRTVTDTRKAFERNKLIGRGMNFGNALEAPNEGDWGLTISESHIHEVYKAGFDSVRLPICWSAHTDTKYPHKIEQKFIDRVDEVIDWCLKRDLAVIITIHHFNDLYNYPDNRTYRNMILSIWDQLTTHYISHDHEKLFFEVLNEPHSNLTPEKWNKLILDLIEVIRTKDKDRTIIIDTANYASHELLDGLIIPEQERNIIVSVRYYLPFDFTHQGAHWLEESGQWLGRTWTGTEDEKNTVDKHLKFAKDWSLKNNRPVTIGEFGSIINADKQSRITWTKYVCRRFEENGFSWSYFDFGVLFRAYDVEKNCWLIEF